MGQISRLVNSYMGEDNPLIITESRLNELLNYIDSRNNLDLDALKILNEEAQLKGTYFPSELTIENGVAVLPLQGTITYKSTGWEALSGGISYQEVIRMVDTVVAQADKVDLVVAMIDSPGGQAYRAFETGRLIREKLDKAGIPSIAYVDAQACSGGYVLASAFNEIVANPDSSVGSIGVRIALNDKAQEDVIHITAGKNKVPYDDKGKLTEDFKKKIQASVNNTYEKFTSYVADMRDMTVEEVKSTEAEVYNAEDAAALGLVDQIMTGNEFLHYVSTIKSGYSPTLNKLMFNNEAAVKVASEELSNNQEETMDIKELLNSPEAQAALQELSNKQVEELRAEMEKQNAEKLAEAQAIIDEKEAQAEIARQEAEQAKLAAEKALVMEQINDFSFISEDNKESLVDHLLSNQDTSEVVFKVLAEAQAAQEAIVTEQLSEENQEQEEPIKEKVEAEESSFMKAIKAQKAAKKL